MIRPGSGSSGGAPSGAAGGDLAGTYPNPTIGTNKVVTAKILDNNVTLAKLATQAASTILANITGGAAVPTAASVAQIKTLLAYAQSDITGTLALAAGGTGQTTVTGVRGAILPHRLVVITESADTFVIVDVAVGDLFRVALTAGTNTVNVPGGTPYEGQIIRYRMEQDGTGGRTAVFNTTGSKSHKFTTSCPVPTLSVGVSAVDEVDFRYDATSDRFVCIGYNFGIA